MNVKASKPSASPTKNQELSITYGGRSYAICAQGQLDYLIMQAREQILFDAAERREQVTEEFLEKKLEEFKVNCGFATLDWMLNKMNPQEKEIWAANYRFCPVTRRIL
jgi:hypothetical protein